MPKRTESKYTEAVARRFTDVYYALVGRRLVKNKREFCEAIGMPTSSNLKRIEDHPEKYAPSMEQICIIVEKYGISAEWLLTGKGVIFNC